MSDKELIKQEIERRMNNLWYLIPEGEKVLKDDFTKEDANNLGKYTALENLLKFIDSLPEETKPQFSNYESVVDKVFGAGNLESWEYEEAKKLVLLAKEELLKDLEISKESASEDKSEKELSETYLAIFDKKYPILPTLKGKQKTDFKNFLNKCQQEFGLKEFGIHPTQSKLFEKLTLLWAAWGAEHLEGLGKSNQDEFNKEPTSEDLEEAMERSVSEEPILEFFATGQPTIGAYGEDSLRNQFEAGIEWHENQMKEVLQTEYEKGRFDMREEMMKDAVKCDVYYAHMFDENGNPFTDVKFIRRNDNTDYGTKAKIIIVKEEQ